MAEEKKSDSPALSALAAATDRLRANATWMLGAFAAVGAVFAAGLSLGNIGKLSTDEPGRLLAATAGIALTVIAVIVAVAATARVTTRSRVSLTLLGTDEFANLRERLNADPEVLGGYPSVLLMRAGILALRTDLLEKDDAYRTAYAAASALDGQANAPGRDAAVRAAEVAQREMQQAQRTLSTADAAKAHLLEVATFMRVKDTYDSSKWFIGSAAFAAAIGLALFAWGANPPDPDPDPELEASDVLPKTPSEVTVVFRDGHPDQTLQAELGDGCDTKAGLDAVAMAVTGETYKVATVQTPECASVWLEVPPEMAAVVPRVAAKDNGDDEQSP